MLVFLYIGFMKLSRYNLLCVRLAGSHHLLCVIHIYMGVKETNPLL